MTALFTQKAFYNSRDGKIFEHIVHVSKRNNLMHLLTFIKIFHLLGLIMGFGGAVLLDLTIFKHGVLRPISKYTIHQTELLSRFVTWGLIVLWGSGFALIAINLMDKPEYLTNQKLWAKMAIVILLTVNGVFVHNRVLPILRQQVGQRIFEMANKRETLLLTLVGSVSFISWTTPFILGKASELNYVTPMWVIMLVYFGAVISTWTFMFLFMSSLSKLQAFARKAADATLQNSANWENMAPANLQRLKTTGIERRAA
jgi:hypothetical protein